MILTIRDIAFYNKKGMLQLSFKLICIDIDGTLLDNNEKISERNLQAIRKAYEKGVKTVVATGRLFASANYFAELLKIKTPVIASNGAYIRDKKDDNIIYNSVLGVENNRKILELLRKHRLEPYFNGFESVYTEKTGHFTAYHAKTNEKLPKDKQIKIKIVNDWEKTFKEDKNEISKCLVIDKDIEKLSKAKEAMSKLKGVEVVSSSVHIFEVMNKGVSKGNAVQILAELYNYTKNEIICIGDNENDLSMIEYAGLGVAMGNGLKIIKKKADYITDTNNNDGVAKVIEKFVLNR